MKFQNIFLTIDWSCILPMLLFLLGAFLLGWLLRSLFGKKSSNSASLMAQLDEDWRLKLEGAETRYGRLSTEHENLKALYASAPKTSEVDALRLKLEEQLNKPPRVEEKMVEKTVEVASPVLLKEVEDLKLSLQAEKNKPPRIEEKIVEKTVEVASPALLKEVEDLKLSLQAEKNKPPRIEEKIVEKTVEVTSPALLKEVEDLKLSLQAEKNKPPRVEEKIVEKTVEVASPALLKEVEDLKLSLQAEKNKPPRIEEKIVEKTVEVTSPALLKEVEDLKASLSAAQQNSSKAITEAHVTLATDFMGKKVVVDDLKLVEGIGPKIEELFHAAGLKTWKSVADSTPEQLKEILHNAGERFQMHDPGTWPSQCQLMIDGKWGTLLRYQNELDGGVERGHQNTAPAPKTHTPPPPKNYDKESLAFGKKIVADDLKLVEGIGPKIEELFHAAGLKTWKSVADSTPEQLKEILHSGGERFQMHDPGTWPRQCQLMVDDKWEDLKKYQDELNGGK